MRKSILFLSVIGLFLTACGPKINSDQQKSLSTLTSQVDSVTSIINAMDSVELMTLTDNFFNRKNFLQKQMIDTLEPEIIFKLDGFIQLRKTMGFIRGEYGVIKKEANIMKHQMVDLNHDVSERLIEEKQFGRYYSLEKANYDELKLASIQLKRAVEVSTKEYNERIVAVESVIDAYKTKKDE